MTFWILYGLQLLGAVVTVVDLRYGRLTPGSIVYILFAIVAAHLYPLLLRHPRRDP